MGGPIWIVGHVATAYLITVLAFRRRTGPWDATMVASIILFSLGPDLIHFSMSLRIVTHTIPGTLATYLILYLVLLRKGIIKEEHRLLYALAITTHVACDLIVSGFHIGFPLDWTRYEMFTYNGVEDNLIESLLLIPFLAVMWSTGDLRSVKESMLRWWQELRVMEDARELLHASHFTQVVFLALMALSWSQLIVYIPFIIGYEGGALWSWYIYLTAFSVFTLVMTWCVIPQREVADGGV